MDAQASFALKVLSFGLTLLGLMAVGSGTLLFAAGPTSLPGIDATSAAVDNEIRCFAAYWAAFGCVCVWASQQIEQRLSLVTPLVAVFFIGGVGRAISVLVSGWPPTYFVVVMAFELISLPVFLILFSAAKNRSVEA